MFNLFGKKIGKVKITDIVWQSQQAKWNGITELWKKESSLVIVCWFETTLHELQSQFDREGNSGASLYTVNQVHPAQIKDKTLIFAEHYPLGKKEEALFYQWSLEKVIIHSALTEPLFLHFGGERILQLMKQLGMQEDESVKNDLISKAIIRAQEKIEEKVTTELLCSSQKEWLERNLA